MPRAGWVKPRDDQRLSDHVALGLLTRTFPPELVDAVVAAAGREQQRSRLLPARLVVYYVLAMAVFSQAGYGEVMRNLVGGLSWESGWRRKWTVPSKSATFQARARLRAVGHAGHAWRVLPRLAAGEHGRHLSGRGRHPGQRRRVRPSRVGPRRGGRRVSAAAAGGAGRVRHACDVRRGDGALWGRGADAGPPAGRRGGAADAGAGRPRVHRPPAVLRVRRHRRGPAVARQGQCGAAGAGALRRRVVSL